MVSSAWSSSAGRDAPDRADRGALSLELVHQRLEVREPLREAELVALEPFLGASDVAVFLLRQPVESVAARLDEAVDRVGERVELVEDAVRDAGAGLREQRLDGLLVVAERIVELA